VQPNLPEQSSTHGRPGFLRRLACWLVEKILVLYYVGTDPKVPLWAKRALLGALIYVFSLGLVLDFLPPFGEVDDLLAFVIATAAVLFSIKPHHKLQAKDKARRWFGLPTIPPPSSPPSIPPLLPPPSPPPSNSPPP
jgi:uncharacterized membrane protein YkvA (DUF1232 family)